MGRPLLRSTERFGWIAVGVVAACGRPAESRPPAGVSTGSLAPADSLVLTLEDSVQIWLSVGRDARDSAGRPCHERTVKITSPRGSVLVPLLYTGRAPERLDAASLVAELWKNCAPMARYRVEVATGRPTPLRGQ